LKKPLPGTGGILKNRFGEGGLKKKTALSGSGREKKGFKSKGSREGTGGGLLTSPKFLEGSGGHDGFGKKGGISKAYIHTPRQGQFLYGTEGKKMGSRV